MSLTSEAPGAAATEAPMPFGIDLSLKVFDRATLLVPNSTLITGVVKNWLHNDRVARIIISINVDFEADPEKVRELLIGAAKAQEPVLSIPTPIVRAIC